VNIKLLNIINKYQKVFSALPTQAGLAMHCKVTKSRKYMNRQYRLKRVEISILSITAVS